MGVSQFSLLNIRMICLVFLPDWFRDHLTCTGRDRHRQLDDNIALNFADKGMHERMRTRRNSWAYIRMSRHAAQYFRPRSSMTRSTSFAHHLQQLLDSRASNHNKDSKPSRKHVVDVVCTVATPARQTQLRLAARRRRGCRAGYRE